MLNKLVEIRSAVLHADEIVDLLLAEIEQHPQPADFDEEENPFGHDMHLDDHEANHLHNQAPQYQATIWSPSILYPSKPTTLPR